MLEVASAEYVEDYKIRLVFNNGETGIVDLENCLWGPMFEPLKNIDEFKQFSVSEILHTLCWKNDADFAPEFLYEKMRESAQTPDALTPRR
ncbi:MAG: DUF2442 domain-containing protein [Candidatus Omnitrophota bacterium]